MVTIAAAGVVEVLDVALAKITEAGERLQTGLQRPSSSRHALPHPDAHHRPRQGIRPFAAATQRKLQEWR